MSSVSKLCLAFLLSCTMAVAAAPTKAVQLEVQGEGVVVVTVANKLPVKIVAPKGAAIYLWNAPDALTVEAADEVLTVTKAAKGSYKISVVMLSIDFDKKTTTKTRGEVTLNVGAAPTPGPGPGPGPDPDIDPDVKGPMRVLVVYESEELPKMKKDPARKEQADMLFRPSFKGALDDRTDKKGPNGRGWNFWDAGVVLTDKVDPFWKNAMKRPHPKLPAIHIFKGDKPVYDGELPKTEKEALDLINKYAE